MSEGSNALYINGINVDVDSLDVFQLFDTISKEEALASAFFGMGFRVSFFEASMNLIECVNLA